MGRAVWRFHVGKPEAPPGGGKDSMGWGERLQGVEVLLRSIVCGGLE